MKTAYLETIERMEPDIAPIDASAFYASAAISLKRIADSLDVISLRMGFKTPADPSSNDVMSLYEAQAAKEAE